jgi:arylsulfatase A-like enzyme
VRVPLLIFEPGRKERLDVHAPTSNIDLLPTVAQLTGHAVPAWAEGQVLPPFGPAADADRSRYAVKAGENPPDAPLTQASVVLVRGRYKLHYYLGYPEAGTRELVKLYDIEADPEELKDLSSSHKDVVDGLLSELKAKLDEVNKPYL